MGKKEYYVKETNVYQIFAENRTDAIKKVQDNKGVHQYSKYNIEL